ncbi:uncharacterized protein LOC132305056 [Cornus florida]|uniref:uncharacterized protein LOC132305056 n=1 Tax=Cornus florida TaxID=4283 RepID=UPI00289DBD4B|nr:uncharacterized protein LOC132305056 [Cornus florida]
MGLNGVSQSFFPSLARDFISRLQIYAGQDTILWQHGVFSLKAAWEVCRLRDQKLKWFKLCWKGCRPRTAVVVHIIMLNKNLSFVNLQKRGLQVPSVCHNCFANADFNAHLFCSCPLANKVWKDPLELFKFPLQDFISMDQIVDWFLLNVSTNSAKSKILRSVFSVTIWIIWKARNKSLHQGIQEDADQLVKQVIWEILLLHSFSLSDLLELFN